MKRDDPVARQLRKRPKRQPRAIEEVAAHRPAARRRLDADLVHPPRFRLDLHQRPVGRDRQPPKTQHGQLRPRRLRRDALRPRLLPDLQQPVFPDAFLRRKSARRVRLDDRPVDFAHLPLRELLRQPSRRLGVAREHYHARHRPVEPVRDAEVDVSGLVIAILDVGFDHGLQRRHAGRHALRQQRRRLGHGQTVVVLEQDGEFGGHRHRMVRAGSVSDGLCIRRSRFRL